MRKIAHKIKKPKWPLENGSQSSHVQEATLNVKVSNL